MAYLIQKNPDDSFANQWTLGAEPFTVGRGDDVQAKIDDAKMSRHHFTIRPRDDGHVITDQGSTNGTWVNEKRITEAELQSNDRVVAGNTTFIYQSGFGSMIERISKDKPSYSTVMRKIPPGSPAPEP